MKQYLKSYCVVLRTVGPVFVGSGREIGKKEYVFLNRGLVGIPDIQRLYGELAKRKKEAAGKQEHGSDPLAEKAKDRDGRSVPVS